MINARSRYDHFNQSFTTFQIRIQIQIPLLPQKIRVPMFKTFKEAPNLFLYIFLRARVFVTPLLMSPILYFWDMRCLDSNSLGTGYPIKKITVCSRFFRTRLSSSKSDSTGSSFYNLNRHQILGAKWWHGILGEYWYWCCSTVHQVLGIRETRKKYGYDD